MLILTADQMVRLTAAYTDRYGNPAPIDGMPRWETSVDGIVTVTPAADGMSADVVTEGAIGTVQVRAVADAAAGADERLIIGALDVQVVGGEARVVSLTAAAPSAKPDAPPAAASAPAPEQAQPDQPAAAPAPEPVPQPAPEQVSAPAPEQPPAPPPADGAQATAQPAPDAAAAPTSQVPPQEPSSSGQGQG